MLKGIEMNIIAALLALFAGAFFALTAFAQRRGLTDTDGLTGALYSIGTMAVCLWLVSPFFVDYGWFSDPIVWIFVITGILFPATSQAMQIFSVQRLGPTLTSALGGLAPVFAVIPAILILGEKLNLQAGLGLGLIVFAMIYSTIGTQKIPRNWPIWALALPLGASLARGITQPFTKLGMLEIPSPIFATMVQASVSLGVIFLASSLPENRKVRRSAAEGRKWFCITGLLITCGILSLNWAISLGDVLLVAPIASLVPLWALAFNILLFRVETVGLRHLGVAVLVVLGVSLITVR
jgi:DME family drug/metabolite transporter